MAPSCAKCGSTKVVANAKIFDQGQHSDGTLKAAFEQNPSAWFFKGRVLSKLRATICGECGFTELFVTEPDKIYEAYRPKKQAEVADEATCLRCGETIRAAATACPACGWTYGTPEPV